MEKTVSVIAQKRLRPPVRIVLLLSSLHAAIGTRCPPNRHELTICWSSDSSGSAHRAQGSPREQRPTSLYVIVKRQQLVLIMLQDRPGMRRRESLPIAAYPGSLLFHCLHELITKSR